MVRVPIRPVPQGPLAKLATLLPLNRGWRTQLYNFETESI